MYIFLLFLVSLCSGRTKLEPIAIVMLSVVMSLASVAMIRQSIEKIIAFAMYDLQPEYRHNDTAVFCLTIPEMTDFVHADGREGPQFGIESIIICVLTIGQSFYVHEGGRRNN